MSQNESRRARITRRDGLKAVLLPAGAAVTAGWLLGCSDNAKGMDTLLTGGAGGETGAANGGQAGARSAAGAPAAGSASTAQAGATAAAGASGSPSAAGSGAGVAGQAGAAAQAGAAGSPNAAGSGGGGATAAGSGGAQAGASGQAGAAAQAGTGAVAGPGVAWASGGTKAMQGNYPDPFETGPTDAACTLYPAQTLGPCYAQMPMQREDISDGLAGLPVRLSFLVTRTDGCTPIPDASVDIWHSGSAGIYSAYATGTICNPGTDDVLRDMFCRGVRSTDAKGRVDFSTVFPGWYTGRTIHIHFTIRVSGREAITSQLYFQDTLTDEILAQGVYATRGRRDTTNASDSLYRSGGATPEKVLFSTAKRPDGVLHAWKILSIA